MIFNKIGYNRILQPDQNNRMKALLRTLLIVFTVSLHLFSCMEKITPPANEVETTNPRKTEIDLLVDKHIMNAFENNDVSGISIAIIDGLNKHELVHLAQENGMDSFSDAAELLVMIGKRIDSLAKH